MIGYWTRRGGRGRTVAEEMDERGGWSIGADVLGARGDGEGRKMIDCRGGGREVYGDVVSAVDVVMDRER